MKRHLCYFVFLLIITLTYVYPALSQRVTFNYIEKPEVDPWSIVISITQDNQGYMWFAGNGIHRYDGKNVITYRNDPLNPNSLIDNAVESLFADDNNQIWIGTQGAGMDCFNIVTKTFTHYRHQETNDNSISKGIVAAITQDQEGNIWIGTSEGLDRLDPKTGKFIHYRHNAADSTSLSNNTVRAIYADSKDVIWVGTGSPFHNDAGKNNKEGGLNRLDRKTNKFTRYLHNDNDPSSLVDNRVRAIYEDSHGTFWVGTAGDGLHSLDRATGKFKRFPYDPVTLSRSPVERTLPFVDDHITFIREDAAGSLWIGTMMGGITQYDPKTGTIIRYGSGKDSTKNFPDKSGWAAYSSRDGIFWISTWQTGLFRVNPFEQNFPYNITGEHVHGIYKEANGDTWVSLHSALIKMDTNERIIKKYFIGKGNFADYGLSLFRDHTGNFWIPADEGLVSFNPLTEKTERYTHDDANKNSLSKGPVFSIFEDHNLNLWVGTFDGLNKMDRKTGKFIHYRVESKNDNTINKNITNCILEDRTNQLWVGTHDGINRVDPLTGVVKNYLKGTFIHSIFEDMDRTLWVGGSGGLFQFQSTTDSFTSFPDPSSGIGYKNVNYIFEDRQKRLWIGSSSGIFRFNQRRDSSNAFENAFGLKNIVRGGGIVNSVDKEFFLSDETGYYSLTPDQISGNFIPPVVAFTDFRLGEKSMLTNTNSILPHGLSQARNIHLSYKQNVFSFDFDVLHFANPQNNQCLYKLENYDDRWRQTGLERTASYFNVPPGHYTFRVKGSNSNGIWLEKYIEVIISPPWWQTWWAYTIFGIFIGTAIWAFIAYRSRKLRRENRILEEKVNQRTTELKQSLENLKSTQAQLVQSEKMASLGALTAGIAHEIQNPLNFVTNFSEVNKELVAELAAEIEKGNYDNAMTIAKNITDNQEKINHHGKRADSIVKGMLQHARTTGGQKEATEINALADEYTRLAYHGMRTKDTSFNAKIETNFDNSVGKINIVPQEIGRVILNLLNNAFYAVNEKRQKNVAGYEPTITISTKKLDSRQPARAGTDGEDPRLNESVGEAVGRGKVEITVKDNGKGIPQNIIDKIFQPFFTTKPAGQGTGLGLSLGYDIVKAHGGEIRVESKENEGSEFIIQLPVV